MSEQRQHPRYAIELDAEIVVGERRVTGRTDNISKGGFCMLADQPLEIHARCDVRLALVFTDNQFSEHLKLPARIAWCTPVKERFQIGVKFGALPPQSRAYLSMFIQFLDEAGSEEEEESEE
jgi:hypothetical protein